MGIIRNIVIKTAIKKALLDVSNEIESFGKAIPQIVTFGEMVMSYAKNHPSIEKDLIDETWEGTFFALVSVRAQQEIPSSPLIQDQKEMSILVSLITQWVSLRDGNLANIYGKLG